MENIKINKFILIFIFFTASCSQVQNAASEKFEYSFSENFCETGYHSFSTNAALCTGLQNNTLNNGCAQSMRQDYFYTKCSGSFTPTAILLTNGCLQINF